MLSDVVHQGIMNQVSPLSSAAIQNAVCVYITSIIHGKHIPLLEGNNTTFALTTLQMY
jgi:hypothetical protein